VKAQEGGVGAGTVTFLLTLRDEVFVWPVKNHLFSERLPASPERHCVLGLSLQVREKT